MVEAPSVENVVKDIGEIHSRLFDHRPFVQGEVSYFLKEFEEKRNDREVHWLFEILENVTEIRETQIDKARKYGDNHLCNLTANLEVALRMCNKIVERGEQDVEELLREKRNHREEEWKLFLEDMQDKNLKVQHVFAEKEMQLKKHYSDLEEKLHISPSHTNSRKNST
ncbi:biogenesis of lysosome-related organelles complex 1 subunit 5 [Centruroides vittatus]|uniref:biogenesis of lysosome-related organelles complex 1 subunit 5 n=1 Tax=Centruroides vittatus TaxID=120091 RepID=UPI000C6E6679|nr:biogenesis of lysosome-related organelles complex 1 subunit 5-like isoform X1 [Centruroides sculpturatus]XP_023218486.1 biogenesis of lysosome-related organelles complex 1 subunit 5-like isoform X2 [Centruroides sculpturatus]